ncbi:hypothetical protein LZ30DRAFT_24700 [Colletotrichum cereale]|nr:hypothetical protein LZ30DRAFT_24700 [Colletotrichum cereale]
MCLASSVLTSPVGRLPASPPLKAFGRGRSDSGPVVSRYFDRDLRPPTTRQQRGGGPVGSLAAEKHPPPLPPAHAVESPVNSSGIIRRLSQGHCAGRWVSGKSASFERAYNLMHPQGPNDLLVRPIGSDRDGLHWPAASIDAADKRVSAAWYRGVFWQAASLPCWTCCFCCRPCQEREEHHVSKPLFSQNGSNTRNKRKRIFIDTGTYKMPVF